MRKTQILTLVVSVTAAVLFSGCIVVKDNQFGMDDKAQEKLANKVAQKVAQQCKSQCCAKAMAVEPNTPCK